MDYRRIWHPGGTYFFTINLMQRKGNDLLIQHIQPLKESIKMVKAKLNRPGLLAGRLL